MPISPTNGRYLAFLKDIAEVSAACGTATYIWGGFTADLLAGHYLREHHDLDGFTRDLLELRGGLLAGYTARGYAAEFRTDFDILVIRRDGLHAAFNRLEVAGDLAMWRHIGKQGTVYFPTAWLDGAPRDFHGVPVYAAGAELDYAIKREVRLLNPEWRPRPSDAEALARAEEALLGRGVDPAEVLARVWAYNPFWAKRGYPEYALPVTARSGG